MRQKAQKLLVKKAEDLGLGDMGEGNKDRRHIVKGAWRRGSGRIWWGSVGQQYLGSLT